MSGVFDPVVFDSFVFDTGAVTGPHYIGGGFLEYEPRQRTKAEIRLEREKYGVIPKAARVVIEQVAKQQVEAPKRDPNRELMLALERRDLLYRTLYAELLRAEILRIREEEEVALLLFMH